MDLSEFLPRFRENGRALEALIAGITEHQARWKPGGKRWSVLEVVNHLADEEVRDFRTRIDILLHKPDEPWPPIDPEAWVIQERYNERELPESLARYQRERDGSLAWLSSLDHPDWTVERTHPAFGTLRAGDILRSWLTHDLLHFRQILRLHHDYFAEKLSPYSSDYAGGW